MKCAMGIRVLIIKRALAAGGMMLWFSISLLYVLAIVFCIALYEKIRFCWRTPPEDTFFAQR